MKYLLPLFAVIALAMMPHPAPQEVVDFVFTAHRLGHESSPNIPEDVGVKRIIHSLTGMLKSSTSQSVSTDLQAVLASTYGAAKVECVTIQPKYRWIWCKRTQRFIYSCIGSSQFRVDDGATSPIEINLRSTTRL